MAVVLVVSRRFLGYFRPRESRAATEMARLCTGFLGLLHRPHPHALPLPVPAAALPHGRLGLAARHLLRRARLHRRSLAAPAHLERSGAAGRARSRPSSLYIYLAEGHGVGWLSTWWFLLVQTVSGAYGVLGPLAVVFITAGFAVLAGVKRMRVVPIETLEVTDELSLLELPVPRARRKPRGAIAATAVALGMSREAAEQRSHGRQDGAASCSAAG